MDFSYSPIREEGGSVGGVLVTVTETTERVLGARRIKTLQELAVRTQEVPTAEAASAAARTSSGRTLPICPSPCCTSSIPRGNGRRSPERRESSRGPARALRRSI